jgi:hypothetical protein
VTYPVFMEAPSWLLETFPQPGSRPRWAFAEASERELPGYLRQLGLSAETIAGLMAPTSRLIDGGVIYLFPPVELVESLSAEQRVALAGELRKHPENAFYVDPVVVASGDVAEWFDGAGLRPELVAAIARLAYRRGDALVFSDIEAVMGRVSGDVEAAALTKVLTRTRAVIAQLRVESAEEVERLMGYWTTGLNLRRKDIEPMLRSVAAHRAGPIDIAHLLPPLPRKLLMTYPDPTMAQEGIYPDCHWTSLNFFNYTPRPFLLDSRLAATTVAERFAPVDPPYKFGDILFFLRNGSSDAFHSCVYIAGDIVFTKNGRNLVSPFVFAALDDVRKVYDYDDEARVQGYRNRKAVEAETASP